MPARSFIILAAPILVVLVVFLALGLVWWPFFVLALPAAAAVGVWLWWRAEDVVLRKLSTRPLGETEGARIVNVLERLCLTSGIDEPDLRVIDDPALNMAVVSGRRNALVVTTGLLSALGPLEQEGVVAHGLSKIDSGAAYYETLIASAPWAVSAPQRRLAHHWGGGEDGPIRFDIAGVGLTRYPPGLRTALSRIEGGATDVAGGEPLGNAWLVPPHAVHTPIGQRIQVLWEL